MPLRKQKQHRDDGNAPPISSSPPSLAVSPPSFNAYSSANRLHQIAARVILELGDVRHDEDDQLLVPRAAIPDDELKKLVVADTDDDESCVPPDSDDEDDHDFEFAFVRRDPDTAEIGADELFSDGQIRATFPVFGRSLPDGAGPSSSAEEDIGTGSIMLPLRKLSINDTAPSGNGGAGGPPFRVWTPRSPAVPPQPGHCKKSRSTGSSSRRWRLRDLLHRSGSDGKEAFVFLPTEPRNSPEMLKGKNVISESGPSSKKVVGPVSAHELYMRSRVNKEGDKRKSFLPYRPGIMGFFASPP